MKRSSRRWPPITSSSRAPTWAHSRSNYSRGGSMEVLDNKRRVYVLGGGISKFAAERVDGNMRDWINESVLEGLEDAGVDIQDIEHSTTSYFSAHFDKQLKAGAIFHDNIGMCPKPNVRVEGGGGTGGLAIRNAHAYIKAGLCDSMIIFGSEDKGRQGPSGG